MTQLASDQSTSNSSSLPNQNPIPIPNQPSDLNLIYQTLNSFTIQPQPTLDQDQPQAPPAPISIPSPLSLVALITHTILSSQSFTFRPPPSSSNHHPPHLSSADWKSILTNDQNQHSIHLNYSHPRSSLSFEFTLSKIGNRISIAGIAVQDDRLSTLDLSISEYVDPNEFPIILTKELQSTSIGFRSGTHLLDFISLFFNKILHHLLPDLIPTTALNQRPSNTSPSSDHPTTTTTSATSIDHPPNPNPIDRLYSPIQTNHNPSQNPLEIGRSDLDPIGTSNLRIPSLYNSPSGLGLESQNGTRTGMLVGPNHPIFDHRPTPGQHPGIYGGDNRFLPSGAVPPGARFDPIGPHFSSSPNRPSNSIQPTPPFGFVDLDPMGGLGQGLPLNNPHFGSSRPPRPDFNDFRPPRSGGGGGGGYDDMFM